MTAISPPLRRPTTNFGEVRDNRRSTLFYLDIDLASGVDTTINAAGNSVYIDQLANSGNALVYFQDVNTNATPISVSAGFIAQVPFTQLRVVAAAQPGKTLRILYGVDIDFTPGNAANVTVGGSVSVTGGNIDVDNLPANNGAFTQGYATITTANAVCLAANANRRYLLLQNKSSSGNLYFTFDGTAATTTLGVHVPPGGSIEIQGYCPTAAIQVIADAAGTQMVKVEG